MIPDNTGTPPANRTNGSWTMHGDWLGPANPLIFRTPVVPTVNDTPEAIERIASFVRSLIDMRAGNGSGNGADPGITYELLAFHKLAADKYRSLGHGVPGGVDPPALARADAGIGGTGGSGVGWQPPSDSSARRPSGVAIVSFLSTR